jgi:hypothetical protein
LGLVKNVNSINSNGYSVFNSFIFLLGIDSSLFTFRNSFVIYQGFFDFSETNNFFITFPTSIFIESNSIFLNLEGCLRKSYKAVSNLPLVFNDVSVFKALFLYKNSFLFNFSIVDSFYKLFFFFSEFIDYSCLFFSTLSFDIPQVNFFFINFSIFLDFFFFRVRFFNTIFLSQYSLFNNIFVKNSKIFNLYFIN